MNPLSSIKPSLKKHSIIADDRQLIVESSAPPKQVSLPPDRAPILPLLDGKNTIKNIVERLMAAQGHVSFRKLFSTLQTLDEAGLLTEPLGLAGGGTSAPAEREQAIFMRPVFELTLIRRLNLPFRGSFPLLLAATTFISVVGFDTVYFWVNHLSLRGLLLLPGAGGDMGYAKAIPALFAMASALMVFKGLAKALLLLLATGRIYDLRLRLHAFGVSTDVSEVSVNGAPQPQLLAYSLGTSMLFVFIAAIAPELMRDTVLIHSLELLAILLTLIELDPYRRSDLTLLLDRVFRDDDSRRMRAYLKNKALFSVATTGTGFVGELRLVVYATLALAWTLGFGLFALELLAANYPNLVLATQQSTGTAERISAAALLILLLGAFGTILFDLLTTIASNVFFPLLTPYLRLMQKLRTTELASFDRDAMVGELRTISFFEELGEKPLREMISSARLKSFRKGSRLIIQGEQGRELFVLLDGRVRVLKRDETGLQSDICTLAPGTVFGEIALIKDCMRTADVVADEDIRALIIEKDAFRKLLDQSGFKNDFSRILDRIALGHYLSSASIFRGMPAETLGVFREHGRFEHHNAGDVIIQEGGNDRAFYLALRGRLAVTRAGAAVAELKQGDFFGEIALLSNSARTATVTSTEPSLLLRLEADAFWTVLCENIALAMNLEVVAERRKTAAGA